MDVVKITIESNAEDATKTFEKLANSFDDSNKQATDLRKQIKGLKDDIYKLTPGTEEYTKALVELGDKMNTLGDIQNDLKASTGGLDTVFQTTTKTLSSMAGGMSAAMGIVTLFGGDTEDLQKQFVQLQAIMAIVNGLSGFSGLTKNLDQSGAALRAFVAKLTLSTGATVKDTVAKKANTAATKENTSAINESAAALGKSEKAASGLAGTFAKLGPYALAAAAAIAAVWIGASAGIRQMENLNEATENYNAIMEDGVSIVGDSITVREEQDKQFEKHVAALKEAGATEEQLNKYSKEYYETQLKNVRAEAEAVKAKIDNVKWYNRMFTDTEKLKESLVKLNEETNKYKETLQELAKADPYAELQKGLADYTKQIELQIAEGTATAEDKFNTYIKMTQSKIDGMKKRAARTRTELSDEDLLKIQKMEEDIADWQYQIELLHATARKKSRDEAKKTLKTYKDNFESMKEGIKDYAEDLLEGVKESLDDMAKLDVDKETKSANIYIAVQRLIDAAASDKDIDKEVERLNDNLKKLKDKLSPEQYKELQKMIEDIKPTYEKSLKGLADMVSINIGLKPGSIDENTFKQITDVFADVNKGIVKTVKTFYDNTADLDKAFKEGKIDPKTYIEAIMRNVNGVTSEIKDGLKNLPETVETTFSSIPGFSDMDENTQNTLRDMLTRWLQQSLYIPDSAIKEATNNAVKALDIQVEKALNDITNRFNSERTSLDTGGSSILETLFDVDPIAMGIRIKNNIDTLMEIATKEYEAKKTEIENAMKQMEDAGLTDTEEYKKLQEELNKLQDNFNKTSKESAEKTAKNIKDTVADTIKNVGTFANSLSSFGSAMADYYNDMAENEAKNEKEKKKYTIKGLQMQKFTAVANIASGIAGAIAGAMQLGFPAGPIVAALESAAVAAAGAIQIKQINRQIKEAGGSSGGNDTPDAAGMVDRIITGETQNADQREQLNAQYTGESVGEQKVYVTQNDITDAQDVNRTAVTQNTF